MILKGILGKIIIFIFMEIIRKIILLKLYYLKISVVLNFINFRGKIYLNLKIYFGENINKIQKFKKF